jgi:nucleoside-diphosphate-sugar epimerase
MLLMDLQGKQVLVTGGAGFIGHHLVTAFVQRGARVRVLDDLSSGRRERLAPLGDKVELITGSIADPSALARAMRGVEIVHHHAALVSVPESVARPVDFHTVNTTGTLNVLEAVRAAGVRRVVYAASSAAYGATEVIPVTEEVRPDPISPYAITKYTGELYCTVYALVYGIETISLRYFNVFGPGQDPKSQYGALIPNVATRILRGESPIVYGDGEQTRDFCFIANVVHANLLAATAPKISGEVVNIACGQRTSVNDVIRLANKLAGKNMPADYQPPRAGDIKHSLADISKAKAVIGYEPQVQFEEGLKRALDYYRALA